MCILSAYSLLKVVGYYDLSVLSMSMMGFQKKEVWMEGGFVSSIQIFVDFWILYNFAKPFSALAYYLPRVYDLEFLTHYQMFWF